MKTEFELFLEKYTRDKYQQGPFVAGPESPIEKYINSGKKAKAAISKIKSKRLKP